MRGMSYRAFTCGCTDFSDTYSFEIDYCPYAMNISIGVPIHHAVYDV